MIIFTACGHRFPVPDVGRWHRALAYGMTLPPGEMAATTDCPECQETLALVRTEDERIFFAELF